MRPALTRAMMGRAPHENGGRRGADRVRGARDDGGGDGRQPARGRASRSPCGTGRPAAPATSSTLGAHRGRHAGRAWPAPRTSSWSASRTRPTSRPSCSARTASRRGWPRAASSSTARRSRPASTRRSPSASASAASASSTRPSPAARRARRTRRSRSSSAASRADVERARPVLEAMGKTITHFGPAGSGQAVKAVNQVDARGRLPRRSRRAWCSRMKAGLDPEAVAAALGGGAAPAAGSSRTAAAG